MLKPPERGLFSLRLILHGRRVCIARKPECGVCSLHDFCPSAFPRRSDAEPVTSFCRRRSAPRSERSISNSSTERSCSAPTDASAIADNRFVELVEGRRHGGELGRGLPWRSIIPHRPP